MINDAIYILKYYQVKYNIDNQYAYIYTDFVTYYFSKDKNGIFHCKQILDVYRLLLGITTFYRLNQNKLNFFP
jgi:hypothetical protein